MPGVKNPGLATRRTPERNNPLLSGLLVDKKAATTKTLTTGGGAQTMTTAELLSGLLVPDTQDAQTWNLPTASQIIAAIPGCEVGSTIELNVVNYGDSTLTIGLGTGVTKTTIAGVAAVLTIATLTAKRFLINITGIAANGDAADAAVIWTVGASAAAVA